MSLRLIFTSLLVGFTAGQSLSRGGRARVVQVPDISLQVITVEGKTEIITVDAGADISEVKEAIEESLGVKVDEQYIFFEDVPLEDGNTLSKYNLEEGSVIKLSDEVAALSFAKTRKNSGRNVARTRETRGFPLHVIKEGERVDLKDTLFQTSSTIGEVKKIIQESTGMTPKAQLLRTHGKEVKDGTLMDNRIKATSIVLLEEKFPLNLQKPNGKPIKMRALFSPSAKVLDVKDAIEDELHIRSADVHLTANRKDLDNGSLRDNMVNPQTPVILWEDISVKVTDLEGNTESFPIGPKAKLRDLKKKIEEQMDVPSAQQHVFLGEKELSKDSETLDASGVKDGDNLVLKMLIKAKLRGTGEIVKLLVTGLDPMAQVRQAIQMQMDVPVAKQKLTLGGKPLIDGRPRDMKLSPGDTIDVDVDEMEMLDSTKGNSMAFGFGPFEDIKDEWVVRVHKQKMPVKDGVKPTAGVRLWDKGNLQGISKFFDDPRTLAFMPKFQEKGDKEVEFQCPEGAPGCDFILAMYNCKPCSARTDGGLPSALLHHPSGSAPMFTQGAQADNTMTGFYKRVEAGEKYLMGTTESPLSHYIAYLRVSQDNCPAETEKSVCKTMEGCRYFDKGEFCYVDWSPRHSAPLPLLPQTCNCIDLS